MNMVENGYQIKKEEEEKMDCLGLKAASKFKHCVNVVARDF